MFFFCPLHPFTYEQRAWIVHICHFLQPLATFWWLIISVIYYNVHFKWRHKNSALLIRRALIININRLSPEDALTHIVQLWTVKLFFIWWTTALSSCVWFGSFLTKVITGPVVHSKEGEKREMMEWWVRGWRKTADWVEKDTHLEPLWDNFIPPALQTRHPQFSWCLLLRCYSISEGRDICLRASVIVKFQGVLHFFV